MELLILPENDNVKVRYSELNNYSDDSGFDIYCPDEIIINAGETVKINFKIKCEGLINNNNVAYYLYPRSSISKTPLRMSNNVGIIDKGYRGYICAYVDNIKTHSYTISPGYRLFQICSPTLDPISFRFVNELSLSERGGNGFGSTNTDTTDNN